MGALRVLLLCALPDDSSTFSYHHAWPRQFLESPRFACTLIDVAKRSPIARLQRQAAIRLWRGDAVVILHSVFSNACMLSGSLFGLVRDLPQPKAYFIGNEYKFMPEKKAFSESLGLSLLVSQSSSPEVHRLYRERLGCRVTGIPHTGLDPALFRPTSPPAERPIDIGYRAADAPAYIGHNERRELAVFFTAHASRWGLKVDISLDPGDRFTEPEWAGFLNRCRGQIGSEAGGDYFSLDDRLRLAVNDYTRTHPGASRAEVHERFFVPPPPGIPLRIMSGRHVEAAGTMTTQLLMEGHYDGYFKPDEHYIPLRRDFSNADEAIRKFSDRGLCDRIAKNAHDVAMSELTYPRLLDRFHTALIDAIGSPKAGQA